MIEVIPYLPAERAAEVQTLAINRIRIDERNADLIARVSRHLPPNQAADLCGRTADELIARLEKDKQPYSQDFYTDRLVAVSRYLTPDRRDQIGRLFADRVSTALADGVRGYELALVVGRMLKVANSLPTDRFAKLCDQAADHLAADLEAAMINDPNDTKSFRVKVFVAVAKRLPPDRAATPGPPHYEGLTA